MEQSRNGVAPPLHIGVVAIEKVAFGSPSTTVANFTYYITLLHHKHIYSCPSSVLDSRFVVLHMKVNRLEHQEGKIIWASGRSMMHRWSRPFLVWWLAVNTGVAMLVCIYAGLLIGNFCLCIRAKASLIVRGRYTCTNTQCNI